MTDKFLYEDGIELSLGEAYTFIQNIANNRIRNFTRIITQSAGFLDDSFEVIALEKDLSQSSTYYLKLKVGGVVFPNGEVFKGNEFVCRVALNKSSATQYLKVKHIALRRTAQHQAFGGEEYAEVLDGVRLNISNDPEPADDGTELLIAAIDYLPDMEVPECSDRRDPWIFFWSPSTIIDPLEILNFDIDDITIISSKSTWNSGQINILNSSDMNSETSIILSIPQLADSARHAWDLLVESTSPEVDRSHRLFEPYPEASQYPTIVMRLPQGLEAKISLRKHDAYRAGVATEWAETSEDVQISHIEENPITVIKAFKTHKIQPYLGIKLYTESDLGTACFVKLWLSKEDNIDMDLPPGYILGLPTGIFSGDSLPYILFPYDKSADALFVAYEAISPAHNVLASYSSEVSLGIPDFGEEETICVHYGSDRQIDDTVTGTLDECGQKIYYASQNAGHFNLPLTQKWPTDESGAPYGPGPSRYLAELEFINYANYEQWGTTGLNFDFLFLTKDVKIYVTYNPPVGAGDTVVVSNTSDATALANGNYTVLYKSWDGTNWVIGVNNAAATAAADTSGTCDLDDDYATAPRPRASIKIRDSDRGDTIMYSGSLQYGQDRDVHFPDTYYTDSDVIDPDDHEFCEGRLYTIEATRVSGGYDDHMQIMGVLKLKFVKKGG